MKRLQSTFSVLLILVSTMSLAVANKPATQEENSFMFGRVAAAMEDAAGGYTGEAIHKFKSINKDLEKREYPPQTRWLAHYWYGKALLDSGNPKAALKMLEIARSEANSEADKSKTENVLRQAQKKLSITPMTPLGIANPCSH